MMLTYNCHTPHSFASDYKSVKREWDKFEGNDERGCNDLKGTLKNIFENL